MYRHYLNLEIRTRKEIVSGYKHLIIQSTGYSVFLPSPGSYSIFAMKLQREQEDIPESSRCQFFLWFGISHKVDRDQIGK